MQEKDPTSALFCSNQSKLSLFLTTQEVTNRGGSQTPDDREQRSCGVVPFPVRIHLQVSHFILVIRILRHCGQPKDKKI